MKDKEKVEKLKAMLLVLLDNVDYTNKACHWSEAVGAVLPEVVIVNARKLLKEVK